RCLLRILGHITHQSHSVRVEILLFSLGMPSAHKHDSGRHCLNDDNQNADIYAIQMTMRCVLLTDCCRRFEVTTAKTKKRRKATNHLEDRAVTSVCPSAVQKSACSCLYTCPGPITKDSRKTIKSVETEISWVQAEIATHTRKIKCTPSFSDASFYLLATVAPVPTPVPVYNGRYVLANPQFELFTENGVLFEPQYTPDKGTASIFTLDSKGRIVTQTSYDDHFFASDDYNDFELMHILPRGWIQARRGHNGEDVGFDYVYCTMQPPSGRYVGGFKELACTQGYFNATVLQYCPLYDEYFRTGTVLGAGYSATTPDCLLVTYLVVPVC
ncbi:glucose N-acetyltransferase, partial [Colletotrichum scovillei]